MEELLRAVESGEYRAITHSHAIFHSILSPNTNTEQGRRFAAAAKHNPPLHFRGTFHLTP